MFKGAIFRRGFLHTRQKKKTYGEVIPSVQSAKLDLFPFARKVFPRGLRSGPHPAVVLEHIHMDQVPHIDL